MFNLPNRPRQLGHPHIEQSPPRITIGYDGVFLLWRSTFMCGIGPQIEVPTSDGYADEQRERLREQHLAMRRTTAGHDRGPRDRDGTFEPRIVRKRQRWLNGVDEIVLSLHANGLTTGGIRAHSAHTYVSKETISKLTNKVFEEVNEWPVRPLSEVYAAIFIDAIVVKTRDGQVANIPICAAIGIVLASKKDVLGLRQREVVRAKISGTNAIWRAKQVRDVGRLTAQHITVTVTDVTLVTAVVQ